jgi:hypothetical protein
MAPNKSKLQTVLYPLFLVTGCVAVVLALLMIWGMEPTKFMGRLAVTCAVLAVGSGVTMSVSRVVAGRLPEDERGPPGSKE